MTEVNVTVTGCNPGYSRAVNGSECVIDTTFPILRPDNQSHYIYIRVSFKGHPISSLTCVYLCSHSFMLTTMKMNQMLLHMRLVRFRSKTVTGWKATCRDVYSNITTPLSNVLGEEKVRNIHCYSVDSALARVLHRGVDN